MFKKLFKDQRGQAAAFLAVSMFMLLALTGLIIDGCYMMYNKVRLESATEAAAHATFMAYDVDLWNNYGIVELDQFWAEQYAADLLNTNFPQAVLISCEVNPSAPNTAIVTTKVEVDTVFMKIFGINKKTIKATVKNKVG